MCVNKKNKGVKQAIVQFSPLRGWSSALFHYAALVFCCHATLQTHPLCTVSFTLHPKYTADKTKFYTTTPVTAFTPKVS